MRTEFLPTIQGGLPYQLLTYTVARLNIRDSENSINFKISIFEEGDVNLWWPQWNLIVLIESEISTSTIVKNHKNGPQIFIIIKQISSISTVTDPKFPRVGDNLMEEAGVNLLFGIIYAKNCMKRKTNQNSQIYPLTFLNTVIPIIGI